MRIVAPSNDAEFALYFDLRWRVLRAPWQQPRGSERDNLEDRSWHFMACADDGTPIGVARLHLNSAEQAQIRYMAVEPSRRNNGVGSALMAAMEIRARQLEVQEVMLHARKDSVPFYARLGYEVVGRGPVLFDSIDHSIMRKHLVRHHSGIRAP